jgi:hypothetical protein
MATADRIKLVSNRVERAKALLLSQFKDSPNINGLVKVLVTELQELENVLNDVQTVHTLEGSYGAWLDEIGRQLKVERNGYSDNDYKSAIKIAMFKKTASATSEDIQRIVELLTGDSEAVLTNNYPYMMELTSYLFCVGDSQGGLELISQLFPANTAIKINKRFGRSWGFKAGNGFGSGATLNSLVYTKYGLENDPRFTSAQQAVIPPVLPVPPSNVTPPVVTGGNEVGNVLTCSNGSWVGDAPITYTYQWLRNGVDISGETNNTYTLAEADKGNLVSCVVTATNAEGSASVQSNAIDVSADTPPTSEFTTNLGLVDGYGTRTLDSPMDFKTAYAAININSDGTTTQTNTSPLSEAVLSDQWLATTGAGVGSDYTVSYTIVSGVTPIGMAPNTTYSLNVSRVLSVQVSGEFPTVAAGTYLFTIRSISDPTISQSRTIQLGAELVDAYN